MYRTFMILGITGKSCAGKDTAAALLQARGFIQRGLSDILREEAKARKLPVTREQLISLGNELRKEHGPGYLARRVQKNLPEGNVVITGIRNMAEIEELKKLDGFRLIGVDAPLALRYEREVHRGREPMGLDTFKELEQRELDGKPHEEHVEACLAAADVVIQNDGSVAAFEEKLTKLL